MPESYFWGNKSAKRIKLIQKKKNKHSNILQEEGMKAACGRGPVKRIPMQHCTNMNTRAAEIKK